MIIDIHSVQVRRELCLPTLTIKTSNIIGPRLAGHLSHNIMGAGRKTSTVGLKEKSKYTSTVNGSTSARNLRKADLGSVIFGCKHLTYKECMFKQLFG